MTLYYQMKVDEADKKRKTMIAVRMVVIMMMLMLMMFSVVWELLYGKKRDG